MIRMHDDELRTQNLSDLSEEELREVLEERGLRSGGVVALRAWLAADLSDDIALMAYSVDPYVQSRAQDAPELSETKTEL